MNRLSNAFIDLPPTLKEQFVHDVLNLGVILELNPSRYDDEVRKLIYRHNGKLKKLYRLMRDLTPSARDKFFQTVAGEHNNTLKRINK
jgi:hypothetical protein